MIEASDPRSPVHTTEADPVRYEWRGSFSNDEVNALHAEAFDHPLSDEDWAGRLGRFSLGWVTARDTEGLVGFVNVVWDGLAHAFILDTTVATRARREGIGAELLEAARREAAAAGCDWLHVDFEEQLSSFYLDACSFTPTSAGLIRLR
jgi:GNAT superfamily N-acetyltransferase